jgi:hypothetical protein
MGMAGTIQSIVDLILPNLSRPLTGGIDASPELFIPRQLDGNVFRHQTMSDICNEFAKARARCNYIECNEWTDPTMIVPDERPIPHCAFRRFCRRQAKG